MEKKLRVAVIGVGGMGSNHCHCWNRIDRAEVVALCDLIPERCERINRECGWNAKVYTDYKELIDNEKIDAVDINTPNNFHSIIAVYAFEHGLHVFSEKPDAINASEQLRMKEASEKAGRVLMVMRNNRYYTNSQYLKKFIADGKAGEIYCGRCGWIRRRGIPGRGGWFTTKERSGGGPLIDLGVHMIDLSIWLMGNPKPVAVSGCTYSKFSGDSAESDSEHAKFGDAVADGIFDVEDLAMGFIRFENGACLQLEFSWASNIEEENRFVELRGTKAGFTWGQDGSVKIFGEENGVLFNLQPELGDMGDGHERALRHFSEILLDGREPDYVPEQGLNMIKILDGIYESARTGHEVRL